MSDSYAYDGQLSILAGEEGMQRASTADRVQEWKWAAAEWVGSLPTGARFTADSLAIAVGLPDAPGSRERPNNVVGAFFSAQSKTGVIRWSGTWARSRRVVGHGNPQRIWEKL